MAPQPSKIKGPGRILGSGDLVEGDRSPRTTEEDREYQQASEEESDTEESQVASDNMSVVDEADKARASGENDEPNNSDFEEDSSEASEASDTGSMVEEDFDNDLEYVEIRQIGGEYVKCRVAQVPREAKVESQVIEDDRFKQNSRRGAARLAVVIKRFTAVGGSRHEKTYDFSETNNANVSSKAWEIIPCKKGTYKPVKCKTTGAIKYKEMSQTQLAKAAAADDGEPCRCKQCELQAKNSINLPVGSSRLRKEHFAARYGAGRALGDDSGSA